MKKNQFTLVAIILSITLLISAFSYLSCGPATPAKPAPPATGQPASAPAGPLKPIKIGWVESLTGMYSTIGIPAKKGLEGYVKWLNSQGGIERHPIELTTYDTESDANKALLAMKKATEVDNVHLIIGPSASGIALALAPSVPALKVTHLSSGGTETFEDNNKKAGGDQHKWNFRPHAGNQIEKTLSISAYMKKRNISKLAFFTPETSFGQQNRDGAKRIFPLTGVDWVLQDTYPGDATTFGHLISKLKERPDVQLIACYGTEMASALAAAAVLEAGYGDKLVIFNTNTGAEQLKLERLMKAFEGLPGFCTGAEVYKSLPDANLNKTALLRLNKIWGEVYPGESIRGTFDTVAIQCMLPAEDALRRLLKEQPAILDKDIDTIRSAVRDYVEKTPIYSNGTCVVKITPENHGGQVLGTTEVHGKFSAGSWTYAGGGQTDPDFVRIFQELAPKVDWQGAIVELAK